MICVAFLDPGIYTVKKVSDFPVPSRDVVNQTFFLFIYQEFLHFGTKSD